MGINRVVFGNSALLDLSTVTLSQASDLMSGVTALDKTGTLLTGTGGGGTSPWTALSTGNEYTVNTTSTTASNLSPAIALGSAGSTKDKIIYVRVRDKAGKRNGYFLGSDCFFINYQKANSSTTVLQYGARIIHRVGTDGKYAQYIAATTGGYGVYAFSISSSGGLTLRSRYSADYSLTINGTYVVDCYSLDYPDNKSVYDI